MSLAYLWYSYFTKKNLIANNDSIHIFPRRDSHRVYCPLWPVSWGEPQTSQFPTEWWHTVPLNKDIHVEVGEMVHSRAPCSYIAGYDWIVYQAFYTGWHIWQYSLASGPLWQYMPHSSLPLLATLTGFLGKEKNGPKILFLWHIAKKIDQPLQGWLLVGLYSQNVSDHENRCSLG